MADDDRPDDDELNAAWSDLREAVTMTPSQLEGWLETEESRSVGMTRSGSTKDSPGGEEAKGHESGRLIVELLRTSKDEWTADDVAQARRTVAYVNRHTAQGGPDHDVETSRWRYSLMNWGHDPLDG